MLQIHTSYEIGVDFIWKDVSDKNILEVFSFAKRYYSIRLDSIQPLLDEVIYDFVGNNILSMEETLRNECLKICIVEDICCIVYCGDEKEISTRSHQHDRYFELLLSWIEMQPVKTAAVEDVVADLEFMEVYCFEFPFCVFKKAKLIEYSKTLLGRSNFFQKEFTDAINYPFYAMHIQALIVPRIDRFSRGTVSSHSDW